MEVCEVGCTKAFAPDLEECNGVTKDNDRLDGLLTVEHLCVVLRISQVDSIDSLCVLIQAYVVKGKRSPAQPSKESDPLEEHVSSGRFVAGTAKTSRRSWEADPLTLLACPNDDQRVAWANL